MTSRYGHADALRYRGGPGVAPRRSGGADRSQRRLASGGAEALLAWAILTAKGEPIPDQGTIVEAQPPQGDTGEQIRQVQRHALDSAYALIGHFVGEQRFDLVRLYEGAAAVLSRLLGEPGSARDAPRT